jgi:hypothetical protein
MSFRHQCELAYVRREVDVLRAELDELRELRASRLAVENAEQEVAELRRRRDILNAFAAERDPNTALN